MVQILILFEKHHWCVTESGLTEVVKGFYWESSTRISVAKRQRRVGFAEFRTVRKFTVGNTEAHTARSVNIAESGERFFSR